MAVNSDEMLIARIAQGERLAMQTLYARHHVRIYRFIQRLVRNEAMAEDLLSDVFLDVWRQAGRFGGRSQVTTWLLSIARFKALSALRRPVNDALDEELAAAAPDAADDPESALVSKDRGQVLRRCINQLSPEHREVLDLAYYQEMSVEEAAKVIGIPEGTVKTRMLHARRKLAELVKAQGVTWP